MFGDLLAPAHLLLLLGIALLVFGPSRLPDLGRGLGEAIREFRQGLQEEEAAKPPLAAKLDADSVEAPTDLER